MARVHFASAARLAMVGYAFLRAFPALGGICLPLFFCMGIRTPDFSSHLQRIYCNLGLVAWCIYPGFNRYEGAQLPAGRSTMHLLRTACHPVPVSGIRFEGPFIPARFASTGALPLPVLRGTAAAGARLPAGTARISRLPPLRGAPPCPAACVQTSPWIFRPPGFSPAAFRVTIFIILFIYIFFIEKGRMFHGASDSIGRR